MIERVDVWDIKKPEDEEPPLECGYTRGFSDAFTLDRVLGKGGFGLVQVAVERATGTEFACKTIHKRLNIPNVSAEKQAQHLDNIDREIKILKRLRGTLSVVHFKGAYEDDKDVHIVMELCRGGELHHSVGRRAYTEELVASFMRSVVHTLAQCHSHRILHRDIKPGNFMLLSEDEKSPLKAIDFGLAVFFEPDKLPRTDLGLDGTPWFMAPEVLNSQTYPESDIWSAGVMAYQLLSGYLPFDDVRNPSAPALSVIWRGILTEEPSFRRSAWQEVSEEAKDFVKILLNKDHTQRPTAKEALRHPWLQKEFHAGKQRPLSTTVVQRIQRYAQTNVLRRTILELIAGELLKMAPPRLSDASLRGGGAMAPMAVPSTSDHLHHQQQHSNPLLMMSPGLNIDQQMGTSPPSSSGAGDGSAHSGGLFAMSPDKNSMGGGGLGASASEQPSGGATASAAMPILGRRRSLDISGTSADGSQRGSLLRPGSLGKSFGRSPSMQQLATLARAANRRGAATVHGPSDYWRVLRQASELAAIASGHGQMNYLRAVPRSEEERSEARKAARLSLDTSTHGGSKYEETLARLQEVEGSVRMRKMSGSKSMSALSSAMKASGAGPSDGDQDMQDAAPLPPPSPDVVAFPPPEVDANASVAAPMNEDVMERGGRGRSAALAFLSQGNNDDTSSNAQQTDSSSLQAAPPPAPIAAASTSPSTSEPSLGRGPRTVKRVTFDAPPSTDQQIGDGTPTTTTTATTTATSTLRRSPSAHLGPVTHPQDLEGLMHHLQFRHDRGLGRDALGEGLRQLGYDLAPSEVDVLLSQLDLNDDESIQPAEFVASQLDWGALQEDNRDLWLECARRAFADLDRNSDGRLSVEELLTSLRAKLPAAEVDYALEDALFEAGAVGAEEIDFEGFLKMVRVGSIDSLDSLEQYDPRLLRAEAASAGGSGHHLDTVAEEDAAGLEDRTAVRK